jgi:transketolase
MLRDGDDFIGMDGFGASGPGGALFEHFGITAAAIVNRARAMIA